jgi:hypothetical protein
MTNITPAKTKILLTLTLEQKEVLSKLAQSEGLSLSAYLRLKALEDLGDMSTQVNLKGSSSVLKIQTYLQSPQKISKKSKDYKNFKDFHKQNYQS